MKKIRNGLLIIIDGCDGTGKSTICKRIVNELSANGIDVEYRRDPGSSKIAEDIRNIALYNDVPKVCETMLMMAAREILVEDLVNLLKNDKVVICDRFMASTYVYQGKYGKSDMALIDLIAKRHIDTLSPYNVTEIITFAKPEECINRIASDGHEKNKFDCKGEEFYSIINGGFAEYCESVNYFKNLKIIDTTELTMDESFNVAANMVASALDRCIMYAE